MNADPAWFTSLERRALFTGVVGLIASVAIACFAPQAIGGAYRVAAFACLAPALGSLLFLLIFRMTGGQWGAGLQPFLTAGSALLPWIWLLTVPLLFVPDPTAFADSENLDFYTRRSFVVVRAVISGVVFYALVHGLSRVRRARLAGDHVALRWVAPAGLISLVFLLHLLAEDWLVVLDPGWHSTAFPLVWMTGQAVAGLACAVAGALVVGANPARDGAAERPLGLDWGNLLLAGTMCFAYVAFAQYLIIWSGNLPQEISWYQLRSHGVWLGVIVALAVFHFALPFLVLLSRRLKQRRAALMGVSLVLLAAQLTYIVWLILPAYSAQSLPTPVLAATASIAGFGFFMNRYLAMARRYRELAS